jgi:hypothetical protein
VCDILNDILNIIALQRSHRAVNSIFFWKKETKMSNKEKIDNIRKRQPSACKVTHEASHLALFPSTSVTRQVVWFVCVLCVYRSQGSRK